MADEEHVALLEQGERSGTSGGKETLTIQAKRGADLSGANLSGANLSRANLASADL